MSQKGFERQPLWKKPWIVGTSIFLTLLVTFIGMALAYNSTRRMVTLELIRVSSSNEDVVKQYDIEPFSELANTPEVDPYVVDCFHSSPLVPEVGMVKTSTVVTVNDLDKLLICHVTIYTGMGVLNEYYPILRVNAVISSTSSNVLDISQQPQSTGVSQIDFANAADGKTVFPSDLTKAGENRAKRPSR